LKLAAFSTVLAGFALHIIQVRDEAEMGCAIAQAMQDRLGIAHLPLQRRCVLLGDFLGGEDENLARPVGERAQHQVDADGGDMEALDRNDPRRKALSAPAEF
jgi:hypothetical protein